jgi:predicted DNA-binding antitoxin AbrB/MazE fold protein
MNITVEAIYEAGLFRPSNYLAEVLRRIDRRREEIFQRRGALEDSAALIREGREQELE